MTPVLDIREVHIATRPPYDSGLAGLSLALNPGDLCMVRLPEGEPITPLADVASGLVEPDAGAVLFEGKEWSVCPAYTAASMRGRIGRVFARAGWLSNLDVDENITLAQRYHTTRDPDEILKEARALAEELGLGSIPAGRPAHVERDLLQRAQWIRALLGTPRLLLLERPGRDFHADELAPFIAAVNRRREQTGVAVVWLTDSHERFADSALRATRKCAMQDGVLREWKST